jgi:hypothetical protein
MAKRRTKRTPSILTRELWTCPRCGAKLVGRNMAHSCGRATLDDWLARMGPRARGFYDRFVALIAACGEYHVGPAKTRIAFLARVRFAGITSISEDRMVCAFSLPKPLKSRRIAKIDEIVPGWWVHRLVITDVAQLDEEVAGWIRESYRLMGMQERLRPQASTRRTRLTRPTGLTRPKQET